MEERLTGGTDGLIFDTLGEGINVKTIIIEKRQPATFESKDVIFAAATLLCGFLYWNLIHFSTLSAGVLIFALISCMVIGGYMKMNGIKQNLRSVLCIGVIAISAMNFILFDGFTVKLFNLLFLTISVIYWVCLSVGRTLDQKLSIYAIGDGISQIFTVPFTNFFNCFAALQNGITKNKHGKSFIAALIGLIICLPIFALVMSLLSTADAAFEAVLTKLNALISDNFAIYLVQFLLGIPVACYLFGLVYGDIKGRGTEIMTKESLNQAAKSFQAVPRAAIYSAMTVLNLIYIIFFLAQGAYLFSAFSDILPQTMTYAEYARRGFFELCTVSGINLFVLMLTHLLIKREEKPLRGLKVQTVFVSIFTILLISTAMSKMSLYIKYYGLTQLRVYASWFMILMLVIFAIVLVRQVKVFNASRAVIISFVLCFLILCYGNVDGQITKYNIERYENGTLKMMDERMISSLSDGAIPYLYEVYKTTEDKKIKSMLYSKITGDYGDSVTENPYEPSFKHFNFQTAKADQIREEIKANVQKKIETTR